MNPYVRKAIPVLAMLALCLSATADAAKRKAKDLLQYIPADTPYVFAYTKPFPDQLMDKFDPMIDQTLDAYRRIIRHELSTKLVQMSADEDASEDAVKLQATVEEFLTLFSVQGLRDAGMGRGSLMAIYGDGVLPVARIALTDADAFAAAIDRIEAKSGEKLPVGTIGRESYRYFDADEMRVIVATIGKDAVFALVPATYTEERLRQTLGLSKPRNSLSRTKDLRKIAKEYGFTDHLVSYINVERFADAFLGDVNGANTDLLAVLEYDPGSLSDTCRAEFSQLAGIAPRIVAGYTEVSNAALRMSMVVELREDIAAGLAAVPAAVPGLGPDLGGLFSFGVGMDPLAMRNFYEARLDAMEAEPFECEHLAELQGGVASGRAALAQPVPPVVYSFRGLLANLTGLEGMDLATETPPTSVDASVLFAVDNAEGLVTMAAMMSPEIAALNLLPDGKARKLDLPQIATVAQEAFAALSDNGLSISLGEGSERNAEAMLQADVAESKPFVSMSMDAAKYYELIGEVMMEQEQEHDEEGEEVPLAVRTAMRDIMVLNGSLYERMLMNVHLTERGVEIDSRMTLAD
ncbi:MAG: hypothetical protein QNJ11_12910 [Woeseiaceae bacterium]|nr:hypothetical protein [Woeseiaceae bacterium]